MHCPYGRFTSTRQSSSVPPTGPSRVNTPSPGLVLSPPHPLLALDPEGHTGATGTRTLSTVHLPCDTLAARAGPADRAADISFQGARGTRTVSEDETCSPRCVLTACGGSEMTSEGSTQLPLGLPSRHCNPARLDASARLAYWSGSDRRECPSLPLPCVPGWQGRTAPKHVCTGLVVTEGLLGLELVPSVSVGHLLVGSLQSCSLSGSIA